MRAFAMYIVLIFLRPTGTPVLYITPSLGLGWKVKNGFIYRPRCNGTVDVMRCSSGSPSLKRGRYPKHICNITKGPRYVLCS